MHVDPGTLSVYVGLASIAIAGWNLYFHGKVREITALHRRLDKYNEEYQDDRIETVRVYATKGEVKVGLDKLESHMGAMEKKIDRLLERN